MNRFCQILLFLFVAGVLVSQSASNAMAGVGHLHATAATAHTKAAVHPVGQSAFRHLNDRDRIDHGMMLNGPWPMCCERSDTLVLVAVDRREKLAGTSGFAPNPFAILTQDQAWNPGLADQRLTLQGVPVGPVSQDIFAFAPRLRI